MESGATAWEVRDMARRIRNGDLEDMMIHVGEDDEGVEQSSVTEDPWRDAILIEALHCLADKKEAERARLAVVA